MQSMKRCGGVLAVNDQLNRTGVTRLGELCTCAPGAGATSVGLGPLGWAKAGVLTVVRSWAAAVEPTTAEPTAAAVADSFRIIRSRVVVAAFMGAPRMSSWCCRGPGARA